MEKGVVGLLTAALVVGMVPGEGRGAVSSDNGDGTFTNPVLFADVPDPDIIRVGDVYYMVSTTMHMSPGVPVMKSYDLVNWETVNYVYDQLEENDACALKNGKSDYANGSWASTIRYDKYEKRFYVEFSCQSTNKSYFFSTDDIENGSWHRSETVKCYDGSMLFEDMGTECKKYIFYEDTSGSTSNRLCMREMDVDPETWDVSLGEQVVLVAQPNVEDPPKGLKAEGVHAYKIGEYYYMFMIQGQGWQRQEICWRSKTLEPDTFEVKKIFTGNMVDSSGKDVMPYTGIAQGGVVDTPDGNWYSMLFQDYGSVGRIPILIPMEWDEEGWPVLGNDGKSVDQILNKPLPETQNKSIVQSDEFHNRKNRKIYSDEDIDSEVTAGIPVDDLEEVVADGRIAENEYGYNGSNLGMPWQWNHNPNNNLWSLTEREGFLRLKSGLLSKNIQTARNTLTQRTYGPTSAASVAIEVANMKNGDVAGLSAFQNQYGFVGIKMEDGEKFLVMHRAQKKGDAAGVEMESVPLDTERVYLKVFCDFREDETKTSTPRCTDKAYFYYSLDNENWTQIGDTLQMAYDWPHFVGYRFGLFYYSTEQCGGYVDFDYFHIADDLDSPYIPEPEEPIETEEPTPTPIISETPVKTDASNTLLPDAEPSATPNSHKNQVKNIVKSQKITIKASDYMLQKNRLYLKKGKCATLKAILSPEDVSIKGVTYKSSNKKVANVTSAGVVKVKKAGTAKIVIKEKDGNTKTTVLVKGTKQEKKNKKLILVSKKLTIKKGKTAEICIKKTTSGTTSKVKYKSGNKKIANVNSYGIVSAKKKGSITIWVQCGKKREAVQVKVK